MSHFDRDRIERELLSAKKRGYTHLLVCCDTFGFEDYSVSVAPDQDVREVYAKYNGRNMQEVHEVYDLSLSIEDQLSEITAMNF